MTQRESEWDDGVPLVQPDRKRAAPQPVVWARAKDPVSYLIAKRAMDLLLSGLALIVLFPFLIVVAAIICLDDPTGGPIFVQDRVGKNGKVFRFFKFRSMVADAEDLLDGLRDQNEMDGPVFKIRDDPRVTRFGRFIRRASIDELPQLVNILRGDMSLVGPRPPLPREVAQYGPYEMQRLMVKPGLTCYWQARGRNKIKFHQWMELDMKYVYHHNLWIDIKLLFLTARSVLTGKGAM
jgi:lipopolysaccharide/colanic/teichoic acid biosynthesis glycosyltransferase